MENKLPSKIKVLSQTLTIIEEPNIEFGESLVGQIDHVKGNIYICSLMPIEKKKVVLIHEALHSIFEQLGLNEKHDDEQLINTLATSIYLLYTENKLL